MATRVYLPSSGAAPVTPTTWLFASQINPLTFRGVLQRISSAMTTRLQATGTVSPVSKAMLRYVIGPLAAQSISGTVQMVMRCMESNAGANAQLAMAVKIIQPSGADRATLLAVTSSDSAVSPYELTITLSTKRCWTLTETQPLPLTTQSALAGDYLVVEIGFRSATTTTRNISLRYGDAAASDCPYSDNDANDYNPWVEFSSTLGLQFAVVPDAAAHAHTANNADLVQHQVLTVQSAQHAHTADNAVVVAHGASTLLVVQAAQHTHLADNTDLTQHQVLTAAAAQHSHLADVATLLQHQVLSVQSALHAHLADIAALVQHQVLISQPAAHTHTADNATVTAHVPSVQLVVQNAAHLHAADAPALTQHQVLTADSAQHTHAAAAPSLVQHQVLQAQSAAHLHTALNVSLLQHFVLIVQAALHAHAADNALLVQHQTLQVQAAQHVHTADSAVVVYHPAGAIVLVVQSAAHAHTANGAALIQHQILTAAAVQHAHAADSAVLVYHPGGSGVLLVVQSAVHTHHANSAVLKQHESGSSVHRFVRLGMVVDTAYTLVRNGIESPKEIKHTPDEVLLAAPFLLTPAQIAQLHELFHYH
jgi:hypothetical protein